MRTPIDHLPWGAKALVLGVAAVAIVACEKRLDSAGKVTESKQVASSSAVLIGTTPAPPTTPEGAPPESTPLPAGQEPTGQPLKENANTWSPADASKELTKSEESRSMPLPGQPNDHSSLAPDASQRAGREDPQAPQSPPQQKSPTQ